MPRHADVEWNLPEGDKQSNGVTTYSWDTIQTALLMDIRHELQKLNGVFACYNFQSIPRILRGIRTNTHKPKRKVKGKR